MLLAGFALGACFACSEKSRSLADIGGRAITLDEALAAIEAQTGKPVAQLSGELAGEIFVSYLEEEVILAASGSPGDVRLVGAARGARARELSVSLCPPPARPTETQVEEYLTQHGLATLTGERLLIRQLILPDQNTAKTARERARRGEDFAALSREVSRAPNAARGGLLGWIERGQLPPEFEAAVFGLATGDTSDPVASNAGWHVFQVVERRAAGATADPNTRERARAELGASLAKTTRRGCLGALATKLGVKVNCEGAPFPCRNPFVGES